MIGWRRLQFITYHDREHFKWPRRCLTTYVSSSRTFKLADILGDGRCIGSDRVTVTGFVRSIRKQKRVAFAAIADGSSYEPLQAVLRPDQAKDLSNGCAVILTGALKPSPKGKRQSLELQVDSVSNMGENDSTSYPIQKKFHSPEFLRTIPHLRNRTVINSLLLQLRSRMISASTKFFDKELFVQSHPPVITSSDCEGAGEVFTMNPKVTIAAKTRAAGDSSELGEGFFGTPKYLTVSAQLHLEALAQSVERVWALSPAFRAERSDTQRHLSEFYMLEAEMCFTEKVQEVMSLVQNLVKAITEDILSSTIGKSLIAARSALAESPETQSIDVDLSERWHKILAGDWPSLTYHQAVAYLRQAVTAGNIRFEKPVDDLTGLQTEHERYLAVNFGGGMPIFVTDYPKAIKPFYMGPSKGNAEELGYAPTVACFDLLMPGVCEVAGGSIREHRFTTLRENMNQAGMLVRADSFQPYHRSDDNLDWYLDLRRYGSVPHGGFGLGFDRLLGYLAGVTNIKDAVTFPRWHGRCTC